MDRVRLQISHISLSESCRPQAAKSLAQVFSSEFCDISKNTLAYRTPLHDCFRTKPFL